MDCNLHTAAACAQAALSAEHNATTIPDSETTIGAAVSDLSCQMGQLVANFSSLTVNVTHLQEGERAQQHQMQVSEVNFSAK